MAERPNHDYYHTRQYLLEIDYIEIHSSSLVSIASNTLSCKGTYVPATAAALKAIFHEEFLSLLDNSIFAF